MWPSPTSPSSCGAARSSACSARTDRARRRPCRCSCWAGRAGLGHGAVRRLPLPGLARAASGRRPAGGPEPARAAVARHAPASRLGGGDGGPAGDPRARRAVHRSRSWRDCGWLHRTLHDFVRAGNTVLVSSRILAEVEPSRRRGGRPQCEGRVLAQASIADLRAGVARTASMRVRTPHAGKLADALAAHGHAPVHLSSDVVRVHDIAADELGWLDGRGRASSSMRWWPSLPIWKRCARVSRKRRARARLTSARRCRVSAP